MPQRGGFTFDQDYSTVAWKKSSGGGGGGGGAAARSGGPVRKKETGPLPLFPSSLPPRPPA